MIEIRNLYKSFDKQAILKDINCNFVQGKTNLIIGQSGSGKTVLLKSIVGLFTIDSGSIAYSNRKVTDMKRQEMKNLQREFGMVFQGSALFDFYNVLDNVMFPLKMFTKLSRDEMISKARKALLKVDLENVDDKMVSELSGGMQKRVAIARAIILEPRYLFFDEPNSGLDPITSVNIDNLILRLTRDLNITTIINTHDMNSCMEIGENIIFLKNGKVEWTGNKDNLLNAKNENLQRFIFSSKLYQRIQKTF